MSRACKHEGCEREMWARGMCYFHYQQWKRANPGVAKRLDTEALILESMPATRRGLEIETGLHEVTLLRHLPRLRKAGKVFILDHQPPSRTGGGWSPVYAVGNSPDHVVPPEVRKAHSRERDKIKRARRRARERVSVRRVPFAALLAPLGV